MGFMDIFELLDLLHDRYVLEYESAYETQLGQHEEVAPEVSFEISGDVYKKLYTVDFYWRHGEDSGVVEVMPSGAAYSKPAVVHYRGMSITFAAVSWDAMRFDPQPVAAEFPGLEEWFDHWMDLEATRRVDGDVAGKVIHSLYIYDGVIELDFGIAPVEAALEFLDLLHDSGVTEIQVSSGRE